MKKVALLFLIASTVLVTKAQDEVVAIGDVKKLTVTGSQLNLITTQAHVSIQVYSAAIIRVRISRQPFPADFSYAVIAQPAAAAIQPIETTSDISVSTDAVKVVI